MPPYGLLGATFLIARLIQMCSLITIIGLTANFISEIVSNNATPPAIFIGTITVTSIAVIYALITTILYYDNILPFLAAAVLDTLILIAVIVVAVILGKPLSYLQCTKIGSSSSNDSSAYTFATHLSSYLDHLDGKVNYTNWIGATKAVCLEAKSIWGLSIALCIMFFFSAICGIVLWRQKKTAGVEKLEG
ncbi:hypothetical protein BO86DRAFT_392388 [Aspergillus japonicus CBS 114.51]|uniref:MARVEL domain-containing protein n=2 Tax=Aspergillus TaxID=5052 RepID=A0A2V5H967_ASPV1|nr:hypothetical protein BO86DRAFT_392388 [Aspergillus japonicus CBS 114.51]PYI20121.1 hypothetical protein BO99DRAFT_402133 [Aspergillus violaceofuscus CBS 115571]RAH77712.1 hypothetical protein BO86DRAFT_392388 [Aspergillus japonicus CBS 114.51]